MNSIFKRNTMELAVSKWTLHWRNVFRTQFKALTCRKQKCHIVYIVNLRAHTLCTYDLKFGHTSFADKLHCYCLCYLWFMIYGFERTDNLESRRGFIIMQGGTSCFIDQCTTYVERGLIIKTNKHFLQNKKQPHIFMSFIVRLFDT